MYWAEHEETLGAIITHVLVHEIGHHFGLSDDDMDAHRASGGLTEETTMKVTGAATAAPSPSRARPIRRRSAICHCTDCQTGTGSAFRVSVPMPGKAFKMTGPADELREDHGGQRQSAGAGVLPEMRLADLFDHAGRRPAGVLHGAGRHPGAARPAHAEEAELVPLGAGMGDRIWTAIHKNQNRREPVDHRRALHGRHRNHALDRHGAGTYNGGPTQPRSPP